MITVVEHGGGIEVECGACGTSESADTREGIAGFVLSRNGSAGVHCCWCGRDGRGLLEAGKDELPSRA